MSDEARVLFEALFDDLARKESIEIRFIHPQRGDSAPQQVWADSIDEAIELAHKAPSAEYGVYFGCLPRKPGGGKSDDVTRVTTVWADLDSYKQDGLDKSEIVEQLRVLDCPPTAVVDSGGGLHVYWRLADRAGIDHRTARRVMRGIAKALHGDPSVAEPARVLRVPGTVNRKLADHPRPVRLVNWNASRSYSIADLNACFGIHESDGEIIDFGGVEVPLGMRTLAFFEDGSLPSDGQSERNHLLGIARNCCSNGMDEATTVERIWDGLELHGNSNPKDPWTVEDVEKIVATIFRSESTVPLETVPEIEFSIVEPTQITTQRLVSLQETFLQGPIKPPKYLVDEWLIAGEFCNLLGRWSSGKTWLSLDLALAIADPAREDWLGQVVKEHGPVLYFDEESPEDLVHERLHLLGCRPELLGRELHFFLNAGVKLDDREWIREVHDLVERVRPALVIFDSFIRFHNLDENSASDMARLYSDGLQPISRMWGAAIVSLDHPTKDPGRGEARGSGDKSAQLDRGWLLTPKDDVSGTLKHSKVRRGRHPQSLSITRRGEDLRVWLDAEPLGAGAEPQAAGPRASGGRPRDEALRDTVRADLAARTAPTSMRALAKDLNRDPRSVRRVLVELRSAGEAEELEGGWVCTSTFAPQF